MPETLSTNLTDALKRLPEIEPPNHVWLKVRSKVEARKARWKQPVAYALAASLLLVPLAYFGTLQFAAPTEQKQIAAVQQETILEEAPLSTPEMPTAIEMSPSVAALTIRWAELDKQVLVADDRDVQRIKELLEKQRVMVNTYQAIQPQYQNQSVPVRRASL